MPATLQTYNLGGTNTLTPAQNPEDMRLNAGRVAPGITVPAGAYLGKYTNTNLATSGLLAAYSPSNTNGLGTAVGLAQHSFTTDANSNVYLGSGQGTSGAATTLLTPQHTASYFVGGVFDPADLSGGDADALTDLGAHTDGVTGFVIIPR